MSVKTQFLNNVTILKYYVGILNLVINSNLTTWFTLI